MIRIEYICVEFKMKYESMSWDLSNEPDKRAVSSVYEGLSSWQAAGHNDYAIVMVF